MNPDRVAVVDCGTNTIRLLIADPDGQGGLRELDRRMEIVRLGQDVDATGSFHPDALQRTFAATERFAAVIKDARVASSRVRFVATSASRDVANRAGFLAGIEQRLRVTPQVSTGDDEARLSFTGALSGVVRRTGVVLVTDIGGGSTELIIGSAGDGLHQAVSLDIGSVRVTERFWTSDPPAPADLDRAAGHVDQLLDGQPIDWSGIDTWIGVAGTLTTLAAIDLALPDYDRTLVDGHRISRDKIPRIAADLATSSAEQLRVRGAIHPGRADVITAGVLIAARIAARLTVSDLTVSEADILDGAALELLRAERTER